MLRKIALVALLAAAPVCSACGEELPAGDARALDRDIETILRNTNVPSASIALVRDGRIVYEKAYGMADLDKRIPATTGTRYSIGSVSKQFTATAILMLADDGKLSLDDPIGKYVPGYTSGDKITIRELINHTAGYADYCPEDYVTIGQMTAVTPAALADQWATVPLDFKTGEAWRYCNTCYVIAGLIVEKVSGQSFEQFVAQRIFAPLHMQGIDVDAHPGAQDARGYTRYAFGPLRPAPVAASGWLFATGGLAMRAEDLALWDIAMIDRALLKPASYEQQFTPLKLASGKEMPYGLGVEVTTVDGHRVYQHGGNISGFLAYNRVYPDDRDAIVVLTNTDFGEAARDDIVARLAQELFHATDDTAGDRAVYDLLRRGEIDPARMTKNALAYFTPQVLQDYRASLEPLGEPIGFARQAKWNRGGYIGEFYNVYYNDRVVQFDIFKTADGKYDEAMVFPPN